MTENPYLLVIGAKRLVCERAWSLGIDTFTVQRPGSCEDWVVRQSKQSIVSEYDDRSLLPMLDASHASRPFDGVISVDEGSLELAALLSARYALAGASVDLVRITRDKVAMREILDQRGFPNIGWREIATREDVARFVSEVGYPIVLKPREGVASAGVRGCTSDLDLAQLPSELPGFIAEAFVDGREFSVECFSWKGRHYVFGVNEETNNSSGCGNAFLELAHTVPAQVKPEELQAIKDLVKDFLTVLGFTDGPSHTEVKWGGQGLRVIETHTRIGGDRLFDLVRLTTGQDLLDMSILWAVGSLEPVEAEPAVNGVAMIHYFTGSAGVVKLLHGDAPLRRIKGVIDLSLKVALGSPVGPPNRTEDRLGFVVAYGANAEEVERICAEVEQRLVIKID